jgi:DNA-binding LacI/PurR family transcriptional regulator
MNIYDIAKLSGVSIATVSRVLNNKPGVSIEARNSVMSVVEKNNFIPNQLAKSLANKKSYVVGIVMPGINHYFSHRVDAINKVLKEEGYSLMITANYRDYNSIDDDIWNFNLLIEKRVDGIIYFPTHVSEKHIELLHRIEKKIPIVVTDSEIEGIQISSVIQDSYTSTLELMDYLIQGGHQRIAFINGLSYDKVNLGRFNAYKDSLTNAGREYSQDYVVVGHYSFESGYEAMKQLWQRQQELKIDKLTAVFAANDTMAMGAIKYLKEIGVDVPGEVSVVGYDGIEFGQFFIPNLTTIRFNQYHMGQKAAEVLIDQIEKRTVTRTVTAMEYDLIIGKSSRTLL